jgi:uncharacterized protein (TIGR02246 family)
VKRTCLVIFLLFVALIPANADQGETQIRALLDEQVAAWNRGDLEAFVQTYWNSPKTAYVGANGVFRGWQSVLDRYRRTYPDRKAMGETTFSNLEVTMLSPDAALVLGHWHLKRESGQLGGVFSLVLRKFPEGWRIILDHTTAMNPPPGD